MFKEFKSFPCNEDQKQAIEDTRRIFDSLLIHLTYVVKDHRYLAITKTKLEEASMFAIKGIALSPDQEEITTNSIHSNT